MEVENEALYGDFAGGNAANVKALEARAAAAESALAAAQAEIAALTEAKEKLLAANKVYKSNLSILFKTAQAEITRKNGTIRELRAKTTASTHGHGGRR